MKKRILVQGLVILLMSNAYSADRIIGKSFATRSRIISQNGMAATSQPLATQAAIDILRSGGSAVDAAIAANAVLGLVEPTGCGIGGDLFAIVWDSKTNKLYGLNASGRSPYSLERKQLIEMGLKRIPLYGPLPVTVPGCVDGWFALHGRFGRLSMKKILEPAIQYARKGFPVSDLISYDWNRNARILSFFPGFKETFMPAPGPGQIFRNPKLAGTLEKIASLGRDVFYRGEIARVIDKFMKDAGGFLSYKDLYDHASDWVEPVSTSYRGYDVWELPPNGQGIAALQILNILEGFDIRSMGFGSKEYAHLFIETKKIVFEDRARFYADPDFNQIPVDVLISKSYAARRRKLIDLERASNSYPAGDPFHHGDTVYLTTADSEGNMVSLIQSNYMGMGSGLSPDGLGFVFHDRGELFTLEEGHFNTYEPHKRPFHTIIPAFVTKDGRPFMSFGVMGGAVQPQMQVQVLINIIDFDMDVQEAGDAPRILHSGSSEPTGEIMTDGGTVSIESGIAFETLRELRKMGHKIGFNVGGFGGYQAIQFDPVFRIYFGASESRKDGQASGF